MKKWIFLITLAVGLPVVVVAQQHKDSIPLNRKRNVAKVQYGVASFYHNKFEGRRTTNGEIFTQKNFTAASNKYPLNCWVKVTNMRNKKSVILRITDRMHYKNPRLIDLSRAAAKKLAYTGHGLTRVRVEYLGKKKPPEATTTTNK